MAHALRDRPAVTGSSSRSRTGASSGMRRRVRSSPGARTRPRSRPRSSARRTRPDAASDRRSTGHCSRRSRARTSTARTPGSRCRTRLRSRSTRRFGFKQAGYYTEQGRKFERYWDVAWFEKELENMARVLITGCSTGIGRAAAVELTKRGFEVIATARRPETLEDLDVAEKRALDVNDDASVAALQRRGRAGRRPREQRGHRHPRARREGTDRRVPSESWRRTSSAWSG